MKGKKQMTEKEFRNRLDEIHDEARKKVVELVHELKAERGIDELETAEITFEQGTVSAKVWINSADKFAMLTAWICDTMQGKTENTRGSLAKKIRKALGYSG